jgi:hypothetical protein
MARYNFIYAVILSFVVSADLYETYPYNSESSRFEELQKDTFPENNNFYNGRIWKNLYFRVKKDQFLFSKEFLPGSVTMNGKTFNNVSIRYDLYKDEILTPYHSEGILQLNKEMVDSFSIFFQGETYHFTRMPEDSPDELKGYVNVIYKGSSVLCVKYLKKIDFKAVDGQFDQFYQVSRIYLVKGNKSYMITGNSDLMKVFAEDKVLIKNFIKKNKLTFSKDTPESFVPVIRYFDTIKQ